MLPTPGDPNSKKGGTYKVSHSLRLYDDHVERVSVFYSLQSACETCFIYISYTYLSGNSHYDTNFLLVTLWIIKLKLYYLTIFQCVNAEFEYVTFIFSTIT